jgi:ectoine hydroxylase-related dioxygenase (phytanoyl-CoA dioxygenase family)
VAETTTYVDKQTRNEFREKGVIHLPAVLPQEQLAILRQAFDWTISHPGRGAKAMTPGEPGTSYGDLANPNSFDAYAAANAETVIPQVISEVWAKPDVWFMYEQVFLKTGGVNDAARRTPWHQDLPYLPICGNDLAVVWISFEPLSEEESLEFVSGSHLGTLYDGSRFDPADDTLPLYGTGELPRLPDVEADRDSYSIVSFAITPGDLVIFHPAMLHGGAPAKPGKQRSTLSLRYFGADAKVALRPNDTEEVLSRIRSKSTGIHPMQKAKLLGEGARFQHPGFPQVH